MCPKNLFPKIIGSEKWKVGERPKTLSRSRWSFWSSHRRNDWIKDLSIESCFGGPWVWPISRPCLPFWIKQAVRQCRRWASALFAARLVLLSKLLNKFSGKFLSHKKHVSSFGRLLTFPPQILCLWLCVCFECINSHFYSLLCSEWSFCYKRAISAVGNRFIVNIPTELKPEETFQIKIF